MNDHLHSKIKVVMKKKLLLLIGLATQGVWASGIGVPVSTIGGANTANANAAEAKSPATMAANPAGLSYLAGTQLENNFFLVLPDFYYSQGNGQYFRTHISMPGSNSGQIGHRIEIPSLFISHQLSPTVTVGFGMYAPFGADFDYPLDSVARFNGNRIRLLSVSLNPNIAFKINAHHSLGLGAYAIVSRSKLRQFCDIGYGVNAYANRFIPLLNGKYVVPDGAFEAYAMLKGHALGLGFNLGWLWDINDHFRLGLSYRSKSKASFKGTAWWQTYSYGWDLPVLGPTTNYVMREVGYKNKEKVHYQLNYPDSWQLHTFWHMNEALDIMGNLVYTRDSREHHLHIDWEHLKMAPDAEKIVPNLRPINYTDVRLNHKNNWQASLGINYRYSEPLELRAGVMYGQSSTRGPKDRTAITPDNDRWMFGLGTNYRYSKNLIVSASYNVLKLKPARIDAGSYCGSSQEFGPGALSCVDSRGRSTSLVKSLAHIVGMGINYQFK